jgi:hypothetical protein
VAERARFDFDTQLAKFTPRQMAVVRILDRGLAKFILYGGAMGGGKSYLIRWVAVRILMTLFQRFQIRNIPVMLACEDYPSLKDRQLTKISTEFPAWLGSYHDDHKIYGKCFILAPDYGSGIICFRNLDDPSKYQSAEFAAILVDELTKNTYDVFNFLRTRLRWTGIPDEYCVFIGGTNPGGVGHVWVKMLWIDKTFPPEFLSPVDYRDRFAFVQSKAEDNPHLDGSYWNMLFTLPESMRRAFRDGEWEIFVGQAFQEWNRNRHVIKPIWPIPDHAWLYMTFDWGFGAPFSIGWWWVDADGRIYRFNEWYGWNGTPNQGLRLADSDIGRGILEREEKMQIKERNIIRLANPDCWNRKPDYKGGGQGKSTAEVFSEMGIYLTKADPERKLKIRQFHERLRLPEDPNEMPMLVVYEGCEQFIRTVPAIPIAKNDPEEIDTNAEDHVFDDACEICMARPIALQTAAPPKLQSDRRIDATEMPLHDSHEQLAAYEQRQENIYWNQYADQEFFGADRPSGRGAYSDVDGR